MQFYFAYTDMNNFMNTLKNLLGKLTPLGQEAAQNGKRENRKPETKILLAFELPGTFCWNEHEKNTLQVLL